MEPTIHYYRRGENELHEEHILGGAWLRRVYGDGRPPRLSSVFFRNAIVTWIMGRYMDSRLSCSRIRRTIDDLDIDTGEFLDPVESFRSFNAFFTRRLKPDCRPVEASASALASPADGRILVYPELASDTVIPAKGTEWSVQRLLNTSATAFRNGAAAVIRLCPADYHRFHFPCDADLVETRDLPGTYHSVNPIALACGLPVFIENKRTVSLLESEPFGQLGFVEIGAFGVGRIVQTHDGTSAKKQDEKGYFEFGSSTIVLLFEKNRITFSDDLVLHSGRGYETLVKMGETIGTANGRERI